jgi:hypothetical protein
MDVLVSLDNVNITDVEAHIANMLCSSLREDVGDIKCTCCKTDSQVILHVNTTKMSVLRTEIKACCPEFFTKIEERMAVDV